MKRSLLTFLILLFINTTSFSQGAGCIGSQTLTATPPPNPAGAYAPGTTVTYCYSVTNYAQNVADWIAGIHPTFGSGWDLTTLIPISSSPSCDGQGNWAWYTSCTGTASAITYGPGFYYDSPAGSPAGTLDGIPGNNFGDNCTVFTWNFCFQVTVSSTAAPLEDLTVCVQSLSDYQAGSWGNDACLDVCQPVPAFVQVCTLIIPTVTVTDATCYSSSNGSITVTPSGLAPYSFQWSNGATTGTITGIPAGIYTVTVTDSSMCNKVVTIPVGGDTQINLNPVVINNGCNASGGSIVLSPSGGSGSGYSFLWSDGTTASSLTGLVAGTYSVTITDSNNCSETASYTISTSVPISLITTASATGCTGANGTATATVSGGTPPFTYSWSPSGGNGPVASNLTPGVYTVVVTDAGGCIETGQATVNSIGLFTLSASFVPLICDPTATTTATVNVTGGTPPFTYQWLPTGGNQSTATGLGSGNYTVLVTDSNSCVDSAFVIIPAVVPVQVSTSNSPVLCNQPNSGTATAIIISGAAPYTYLWSNGSTLDIASNLAGGTYTVTVTDVNGCSGTATAVVQVIPDVFASAGTNQNSCSGQPVTITGTGTGGTPPFAFTWDNGSTSASQTVNPTDTTFYTVTVIDASGCTATSTVTINVQDYPVVTVSPDVDICPGSPTTLQASGGTTYSWSPTDGLSDANIANPVASPSASTTYTVTVGNGFCTSTGSIQVIVTAEVTAAFSPDTTAGEAPLTVNFNNTSTGATSYEWDFGDGNTSTDVSPTHIYTQQGNYVVELVATNNLGCTDTLRFSFIVVDELASLIVPNVFTPNGDGINDTFSFIEQGISSITVQILNRWGNEVYSWNKTNSGWDGKSKDGTDLPDGVYLYIIQAQGINDKPYNYQGAVQMIRGKK